MSRLTPAPNVDSECTGTNLGDVLRATDLKLLPDELIAEYDMAPARRGA
jgi:hypothetical protein